MIREVEYSRDGKVTNIFVVADGEDIVQEALENYGKSRKYPRLVWLYSDWVKLKGHRGHWRKAKLLYSDIPGDSIGLETYNPGFDSLPSDTPEIVIDQQIDTGNWVTRLFSRL